MPLKNFQTPPIVILSHSFHFQIQFPKWNPDIFWTPATFTFSHSPSSLSNLIPKIKHYSLFHTQTPFHPQLPLPFSHCHSALPPPTAWVLSSVRTLLPLILGFFSFLFLFFKYYNFLKLFYFWPHICKPIVLVSWLC